MKKTFFNKKLKKIDISLYEIILFLLILSISIFLRFWNLEEWYLINGDEKTTLRDFSKSFLELKNVNPSTAYFPQYFITNMFFFINSFPEYRYITSFFSLLSTIFFYLAARITLNDKKKIFALIAFLLVSIDGLSLFMSRVFANSPISYFLNAITIYLFFKWSLNKNKKLIFLICLISALSFYNYTASIFFFLPVLFLLFLLTLKYKKAIKIYLISIFIIFLLVLPYVIKIYYSDRNLEDARIIRLIDTGFEDLNFTLNIFYPEYFLEVLNEYFQIDSFFIFFIPILLIFIVKKDDYLKYLIFVTYGIFLMILLYPNPIQTHHLVPLVLVFYILLTKEFTEIKNKFIKIFIISIFIILIYINLIYLNEYVSKNSYQELQEIRNLIYLNNITEVYIEKQAHDILKYTNYFVNLHYKSYACRRDIGFIGSTLNKTDLSYGDFIISFRTCDNLKFFDSNFTLLRRIDELRFYIYEPSTTPI